MDDRASDDLTRSVELLNERLAATRARLAAQDERLARLRDDLKKLKLETPKPRAKSRDLAPALTILALTIVVGALRETRALRVDNPLPKMRDAVAATLGDPPPAPAMTPPTGDNAVAEGLRLIYAYRPTPAKVTVGELLEPMLGKDLKPTSFELFPASGDVFRVVFKPYTDDVGIAHQYEFEVDPIKKRVIPTGATQQLLRADAAGFLASRSDFEGLRQALDLSREGEVLVGQPSGRVSR